MWASFCARSPRFWCSCLCPLVEYRKLDRIGSFKGSEVTRNQCLGQSWLHALRSLEEHSSRIFPPERIVGCDVFIRKELNADVVLSGGTVNTFQSVMKRDVLRPQRVIRRMSYRRRHGRVPRACRAYDTIPSDFEGRFPGISIDIGYTLVRQIMEVR